MSCFNTELQLSCGKFFSQSKTEILRKKHLKLKQEFKNDNKDFKSCVSTKEKKVLKDIKTEDISVEFLYVIF